MKPKAQPTPKVFLLSGEDSIIAFHGAADAHHVMTCGDVLFDSLEQFDQATQGWPGSRLIHLWNHLPDASVIKKFTDRATALNRIWTAIQVLEPLQPKQADPPAPAAVTGKAKPGTKKATLLSLLDRPEGASVREIMAALDWQSHSVRGFLSTLSRQGTGIHSFHREDGIRAYFTRPESSSNQEDAQ